MKIDVHFHWEIFNKTGNASIYRLKALRDSQDLHVTKFF